MCVCVCFFTIGPWRYYYYPVICGLLDKKRSEKNLKKLQRNKIPGTTKTTNKPVMRKKENKKTKIVAQAQQIKSLNKNDDGK